MPKKLYNNLSPEEVKEINARILGHWTNNSSRFSKPTTENVVYQINQAKDQAIKNKNWEQLKKLEEQEESVKGELLIIKLDEKIQNLHNNTELEKRYYSQKLYNLQLLSTFLSIILAFSFLLYVYIIWRNKIKNIMIKSTEKIKNMKLEIPKKKQNIKEIIEDVKEKYISKMDDNEIIIISVVISTIIASALGYCTGETLYFKNNGDRGSLEHHSYSEFHINYFIVIISFIISGGLSYLYLKKK